MNFQFSDFEINNKALFILYLLIASNYLNALYNCRLQDLFERNMYLKHIFGFFTLFFFVVLTEQSIQGVTIMRKVWMTVKIYILFVLTTRMNQYLFVIIWFIFFTSVVISIEIENSKDETYKDKMKKVQSYLSYLGIIVIILGVLTYLGEKKNEYGKSFNYKTFFVGTVNCRKYTGDSSRMRTVGDFFKFLKIGLTQ